MNRPVIYAKPSPAPSTVPGTIKLYRQTWEGHIEIFHPEVEFHHIQNAMDDPCYICESKTVADAIVLINERDTNEDGDPLRVPMHPENGHYIVTSAYYSSATSHGKVIWRRGDE